MLQLTHTFASAEAASHSEGLFGVLGIDWRTLLLQLVAFIILVWILSKFVYPPLVKAIDKREKAIADSVAAATEAEAKAEQAQKEISKLLADARSEATEIVDRASTEAANMVKTAEDKAKVQAERIVADARTQLDADIIKARKALKADAVALIAAATEKVVGEKLDASKDTARIKQVIEEGRA
jgi:F-type H+-transporting ATPase subunit b